MKRCAKCGIEKPVEEFYKSSKAGGSGQYAYCRPCTLDWQRTWRAAKKDDPQWLERERERARVRSLRSRDKLRREVIAAYGGKCSCCDEATFEFLSLDHVNNDGAQHRRELGANGGTTVMAWARRNGYPPSLQILCHNCHGAKSWHGRCPHD